MEQYSLATRAIHAGQDPQKWSSCAIIPPISLATTFQQPYPAQPVKYEYSRSGNPTRDATEEALAALENAKYGLAFSSGLATINTIYFAFIKTGENMICADDVYGGTGRLFRAAAERLNGTVDFVDISNVDTIVSSIKKETKLLWLETPTNPTLRLCDIKQTVDRVKAIRPDIIICVDNTFMTPVFQLPLNLGADMSVHSLTKYINGHSDVVMGCCLLNNKQLYDKLKFLQNALGAVPSPFDCFLVNRGLKTLALRMEKHHSNALKIAQYLESHPKVEKVLFPGLKSHPQHDICLKQCTGFSGMCSFYIKGESDLAIKFTQSCKLFTLAESLGAVESLIEIPSLMTHASVPSDLRAKLGITDSLIRVSIGIENVEDLIADLESAFELI